MSNAMAEDEVRAKFGDHFGTAYETMANQDKHELIMLSLQAIAEDPDDLKMFVDEFSSEVGDEMETVEGIEDIEGIEDRLVGNILQELGDLPLEQLATFLENAARKLRAPPKCTHPQLYGHVTFDVVIPVAHSSAASMTRLRERIHNVLEGTELTNYRVRSGIEIDEDSRLGE